MQPVYWTKINHKQCALSLEKQAGWISTWTLSLMNWRISHVRWLHPLGMGLTRHEQRVKGPDTLEQSLSLTSLRPGGYLPAYRYLGLKFSTWDVPSTWESEEWCSHYPFSSTYCAGDLFDKPGSLDPGMPQKPNNMVTTDMMWVPLYKKLFQLFQSLSLVLPSSPCVDLIRTFL